MFLSNLQSSPPVVHPKRQTHRLLDLPAVEEDRLCLQHPAQHQRVLCHLLGTRGRQRLQVLQVAHLVDLQGGGVGLLANLQLMFSGGHSCQGGPQAGMLGQPADLQRLLPLALEESAMQDLAVDVHVDGEQGAGTAEGNDRVLEALDDNLFAEFPEKVWSR